MTRCQTRAPRRDIATGEWKRRNNNELEELYDWENTVSQLIWARHVLEVMTKRLLNIINHERPEERRSDGRPRRRVDPIEEDLKWKQKIDRSGW